MSRVNPTQGQIQDVAQALIIQHLDTLNSVVGVRGELESVCRKLSGFKWLLDGERPAKLDFAISEMLRLSKLMEEEAKRQTDEAHQILRRP